MRIVPTLTLCFAITLYGASAHAVDVTHAEVEHINGVYRVDFEVRIDADQETVRKIVTDYQNFTKLTPTVLHSEVISRDGGRVRLDLQLRACVWKVFCRRMRKVTDATVNSDGSVVHRTVASESDFSYAEEQLWVQSGEGHRGTLARYRAELVPKFFVPPLIGPWLIRRQIVSELTKTAKAIEEFASR